VTFPVAVDSVDCLWDSYGFDHLPNGYYVDERGIIRYLKIGGFDIRETLNEKIIEDLITEKWSKKPLRFPERPKLNLKKEIAELGQQLKSVTRGVEKRLRLADLLVKTSQYRKAAREYDTVLAQQPRNARALFARGVVFHREGKLPQAILSWRRHLRQAHQLGDPQADLGMNFQSAFIPGFIANGRANKSAVRKFSLLKKKAKLKPKVKAQKK
jgi:tetratricopeptide (TPR) repeat protein